MPELPEVEHLRRTLVPRVIGARIARARLLRADVTRVVGSARRARAGDLLEGGVVREIARHGKHLALVVDDGRVLDVHLGMSGQLVWMPSDEAEARPHVHARWLLERAGRPAGTLLFRDPRRFGRLVGAASQEALRVEVWGRLGPDALGVEAEALAPALTRTGRSIKAVLLDQGVLAGVGNIYADEALFRARVRPDRPASGLTGREVDALALAIREVLAEAIEAGGSTLRDYRDAEGRKGGFQGLHAAYGRGGLPCSRCGMTLTSERFAQRTSVFCTHCQH